MNSTKFCEEHADPLNAYLSIDTNVLAKDFKFGIGNLVIEVRRKKRGIDVFTHTTKFSDHEHTYLPVIVNELGSKSVFYTDCQLVPGFESPGT